jgi:glycosyltransferase involved in cell wall biosynthesis
LFDLIFPIPQLKGNPGQRMKVLIADFDFFAKVGGGQTFYRNLIRKNPHIEFYYFIQDEKSTGDRPANAHGILFKEAYLIQDLAGYFDIDPPQWAKPLFVQASNLAALVQGMEFDVVDTPDYYQWGLFLAPALRHHEVNYQKLALSMHGVISTTLRLDWFQDNAENLPLRIQEQKQYEICDLRYGISRSYLEEWQAISPASSHYYHPLHFFDLPDPVLTNEDQTLPDLNFVGRTEKRKGPDIFIELAWWLPQNGFDQANIIGPHSFDPTGTISSESLIRSMLKNRLESIQLLPAQSQPELFKRFQQKSITFTPSRYDTLNLVALESLFSGCPTAIGAGAGVCRLLADDFPNIPWVKIDISNIYAALEPLVNILENYQTYRQQLVEAVKDASLTANSPNITEIYQTEGAGNAGVQAEIDRWYAQLINYWQKQQETFPLIQTLKTQLKPITKPVFYGLKNTVNNTKEKARQVLGNDYNAQALKVPFLGNRYRQVMNQSEQTNAALDKKLEMLWRIGSGYKSELLGMRGKLGVNYRVDRVRLWRELARVEELRGNTLITATYKLRALRAIGEDKFGDLPGVLQILEEKGFHKEAQAVAAMYGGDSSQRGERCFELIEQARIDNLHNPANDQYEIWDDRRQKTEYSATIIVSLYKAEQKLKYFLETLQHQTLIKRGEAEVILVDSGSPTDEYSVFKDIAPNLGYDLLYVRSAQRETIQSAWNRGISLAHSPYLAFLGVDETILPQCLEILAKELDQDPELDWAIGHSLVTNVDPQGSWVNDIMPYDRTGYEQDLVYLETCYLSWVGALYRKSIHDRFGYYDASFRGAGDTEFKSRVMPFIKSKVVDQILGLFWNYPEDRTTQSPNIEIEDTRAWYLHRTLAGVKYAFQGRSPEEVENLLYHCLGYRKSYCQHTSTDFDHAYNLAQYLHQLNPQSPALKFLPGIQTGLECYRAIDYLPSLEKITPVKLIWNCRQQLSQIEQEHRSYWPPGRDGRQLPTYKIFNDNRHEQHAFLWFSDINN